MYSSIEREHMRAYVIERLNDLGYYDTEGLSYEELKYKLVLLSMQREE